jgi:hypothetical protein
MREVFGPREAWLAERAQPVLRLDSAASPQELVRAVLDWRPHHPA